MFFLFYFLLSSLSFAAGDALVIGMPMGISSQQEVQKDIQEAIKQTYRIQIQRLPNDGCSSSTCQLSSVSTSDGTYLLTTEFVTFPGVYLLSFTLYDIEMQAKLASEEYSTASLTETLEGLPSFFQSFGRSYLSKLPEPVPERTFFSRKNPRQTQNSNTAELQVQDEFSSFEAEQGLFEAQPGVFEEQQGISGVKQEKKSPSNYTLPNYLFSTSAIPLKQGDAYISAKELLYVTAGYGLTKDLTIIAEAFVFPEGFLMLGGQYSFYPQENVYIGLEVRSFFDSSSYYEGISFMGSLSLTLGTTENNFTCKYVNGTDGDTRMGSSLGWGGPQENFLFFVSGMTKLTPRVSLVSENFLYYWDLDDIDSVVHSIGARFFFQKRDYIDLGFAITGYDLGDYNDTPFPWIGYTVPFPSSW